MIIAAIIAFVVGVVVGAFSHKWLASEVTKETGVNPSAVASEVNKDVKKV